MGELGNQRVRHLAAGTAGGLVGSVMLQPLDLLKTRVQQQAAAGTGTLSHMKVIGSTLRPLLQDPRRLRELWRGALPSVMRASLGSGCYFFTLNQLRRALRSRAPIPPNGGPVVLSDVANLTSGAVARTFVGMLFMPVTVLKVRFESNIYAYRNLVPATREIIRTEGVRGLFSGFGATAMRDAPHAGIYVLIYERCKLLLLSRRGDVAVPSTGTAAALNLISGIVAGGTATALTNPFDMVKTRMQLFPARYRSIHSAFRLLYAENGVRGFFNGFALRVTRKAFSSALTWTVYEMIAP